MRILPLLLPLVVAAPLAAQTGTLDQSSPFTNASYNVGTSSLVWQAQVRTGIGGTLEGFTIELLGGAGATVDLGIRVGAGWNTSAAAWTATATCAGTGTWESFFMDCSAAAITLAANDVFVIEMTGNSGANARGEYIAPPASPPYPEYLYLNGPGCFADCGWRIGFQTWMLSGPPPLTLSLNGSCPGVNVVSVANATAGGLVAIASGLSNTPSAVPNGPCAGTFIGMSNPALRLLTAADGNGNLSVPNANVPAVACGNAYLQALDVASCQVSNLVAL